MAAVNREHKDRLFTFLFGEKGNKAWTLSLYNAVNKTHHTDPDSIEFTTMEDAIYMGMKNDLSFIFSRKDLIFTGKSWRASPSRNWWLFTMEQRGRRIRS